MRKVNPTATNMNLAEKEMSAPERERYKLCLTPDYDAKMVCQATRISWRIKSSAILQRIQRSAAARGNTGSDLGEKRDSSSETVEKEHTIGNNESDLPPMNHSSDCSDDTEYISTDESEEESASDLNDLNEKNLTPLLRPCSSEAPKSTTDQRHGKKGEDRKQSLGFENSVMFDESSTTIGNVILMITGLTLKFGICNEGRKQLMEMFKLCAGPRFSNVNISNYYLDKISESPKQKVQSHYYCTQCYNEIYCSWKDSFKNQTVICEKCSSQIFFDASCNNYFLTIDLKHQLNEVMKIKSVRSALQSSLSQRYDEKSEITDCRDGKLYKLTVADSCPTLSLNFSTDGAPIFHESKRNMWPLQVILNDLPPDLRFTNVLIVGLMIVQKEPNPTLLNLFLKKFVEDVKELHDVGFHFNINDNGVEELLIVSVLCCSVDSVARALCQNRVQHNGYYACSYCYIQGRFNKTMRFPFSGNNEALRTHESHMKDVDDICENPSKLKSRGVKGPSILSELPNFDMVWSFPFDELHTGELGAEQLLWELTWKPLNRQQKERINGLLMDIKPPHDVGTLPKDLFDTSNYKAKNWRSLSLYYGIPICVNILSGENLYLFALLMKSMYILSQMRISDIELEECEILLALFVIAFQERYSESCMRFNIHMLLHAVDSVRKCGPLWANSTYAYESNIHFLKRLINGSKGVDLQIMKKSMNIRSFQAAVDCNSSFKNSNAEMYCDRLFSNKRTTTNNEKSNGVVYFDAYDPDSTVFSGSEKFFKKCICQGTVYTSAKYKRSSKWNDSFVQLRSGANARIMISYCRTKLVTSTYNL